MGARGVEEIAYSEEIAERVLAGLMDGRSLSSVCRDKGMPHRATVLRWVARNGEFQERYKFATEIRVEVRADDIYDIAADASNDLLPDGSPNSVAVQRAKLMIDAIKWDCAKTKPKKYGDRIDLEHSGTVAVKRVVTDL